MYDFYLGGTAYNAVDRAAAERVTSLMPEVIDGAWANRGFLQRAVRRMAAEFGVRQFIDVGSGLPTQRNTHDVLADVTPDGRVVYVDIDPAAVSRANKILSGVEGAVAIQADVRAPEAILGHPDTRRLIDFTQPVGLLMVAVLHFIPDADDPWSLVARYLAAVPSGSYLALSHGSGDQVTERMREAGLKLYAATTSPATERTRTEIARFFDGLEIVPPYPGAEPAVTFTGLWGAEDPAAADSEGSRLSYAALGRKP
jgi:hypothetical protein